MVRAKAARQAQAARLTAEVEQRLALPLDQWEPVGNMSDGPAEALARIAELRRTPAGPRGDDAANRQPLVRRDDMGVFDHIIETAHGEQQPNDAATRSMP